MYSLKTMLIVKMSQANAKPKYMKTPSGIFYIAGHNLAIRSKDDKTVVGKQNKGEISPLTEEDVIVCKELEVDYLITRGDSVVLSRSGDEFTVKSSTDLTVVGRWLDGEPCLLNEDDVELCNKYGLVYDPACVSEEDGVETDESEKVTSVEEVVEETVEEVVEEVVEVKPVEPVAPVKPVEPVAPVETVKPVDLAQTSVASKTSQAIHALVQELDNAYASLQASHDALTATHTEVNTKLQVVTRERDELSVAYSDLKKKWDIIMSVAK